jgi:hypothetical protein
MNQLLTHKRNLIELYTADVKIQVKYEAKINVTYGPVWINSLFAALA